MHQQLAGLVFRNGRIAAFVQSFVGVGHVAGRAAGAAIVAALLAPRHADVAALALLARIGDAGQVGVLGNLIEVDVGNLLHVGRHLIRMRGDESEHVVFVSLGAEDGGRAVIVIEGVVAPHHLVAFLHAPGPQVALDLAGLGVHQRLGEAFGVTCVTLAAGLVGYPDRAGIGIEHVWPAGLCQLARAAGVGTVLVPGGGITAVAGNAARRITVGGAHGHDRQMHRPLHELLDSVVAVQAPALLSNCAAAPRCDQKDGKSGDRSHEASLTDALGALVRLGRAAGRSQLVLFVHGGP